MAIPKLSDLSKRVALVVGASQGLGCGIAQALSEAGASVALVSRAHADIIQAAAGIRALVARAEIFPADIVGTAVFLAAPASDYLTGQTIIVDGDFRTA